MQIVPNHLVGIEMDTMPKDATMGADAVHLEVDVHATKDETHGFPEDAWISSQSPQAREVGSQFRKTGQLVPIDSRRRAALCE
jgi:uncharacterized protein involved in high-affinity Fe2+ transport